MYKHGTIDLDETSLLPKATNLRFVCVCVCEREPAMFWMESALKIQILEREGVCVFVIWHDVRWTAAGSCTQAGDLINSNDAHFGLSLSRPRSASA